jgi:hypothetical protein
MSTDSSERSGYQIDGQPTILAAGEGPVEVLSLPVGDKTCSTQR